MCSFLCVNMCAHACGHVYLNVHRFSVSVAFLTEDSPGCEKARLDGSFGSGERPPSSPVRTEGGSSPGVGPTMSSPGQQPDQRAHRPPTQTPLSPYSLEDSYPSPGVLYGPTYLPGLLCWAGRSMTLEPDRTRGS
jgi:hypothetical protein